MSAYEDQKNVGKWEFEEPSRCPRHVVDAENSLANYIPCLSLECWSSACCELNFALHFEQVNCPATEPVFPPTAVVFIIAPRAAMTTPTIATPIAP